MTDHTSPGGGVVSPVPDAERPPDAITEADAGSDGTLGSSPVPMTDHPIEPSPTSEPEWPVAPVDDGAGTTPGPDVVEHGPETVVADHAPPAPQSPVARPGEGDLPEPIAVPPLPRVIAVANQKGGVGKTTTTVNMGAALAERDFRVLVVDLDPQGNATTGLGINYRVLESTMYDVLLSNAPIDDCIEPTEVKGLFVAPASLDLAGAEIELVPAFNRESKLKRALEDVREEYDYILIDCPPSLGLLTVNGLVAATEVMVPIQCEYYALEGLAQLTRNVELVRENLNPVLAISSIVMVMYDSRTKLGEQVVQEVRDHFGPKVCRNMIPRNVKLSEAPSFGQPITTYASSSSGAVAYRELAREVSGGA